MLADLSDNAIWINGIPELHLPVSHRGLAYGDGVFESMRLVQAKIPLWRWHAERLQQGLQALGLNGFDLGICEHELHKFCANFSDAYIKLIVAAGGLKPGYARDVDAPCDRIMMQFPAPLSRSNLRLMICKTVLSVQPGLAGVKHLNRLDQVLATREVQTQQFDDGLLCAPDGRVVCGTAANVFVDIDGQWHTPEISDCGVAGVARAALLAHWQMPVTVRPLCLNDFTLAREVFLTNAVRGVQSVSEIQMPNGQRCRFARQVGSMAAEHCLFSLGFNRRDIGQSHSALR